MPGSRVRSTALPLIEETVCTPAVSELLPMMHDDGVQTADRVGAELADGTGKGREVEDGPAVTRVVKARRNNGASAGVLLNMMVGERKTKSMNQTNFARQRKLNKGDAAQRAFF